MNFRNGSPFRGRIKILGKATGTGVETLTQATFVDRLLKTISSDPMRDRDLIKRGKSLPSPSQKERARLVFRERFIAEKDAEIAKVLWNYFDAVSSIWSDAWNKIEQGNILPRTTGFAALMRFLPNVLVHMDALNKIPSAVDFRKVLKEIDLRDRDFTSDNFKPGSSGEGALYDVFVKTL
jgi:hypothetical protein